MGQTPQSSSEGAAPAPQIIPVLVSQDSITQQVMADSQIDVESMETVYVTSGAYNHVAVGGMKEVELPNNRGTILEPKNLQDLHPEFSYIWLSDEDRRKPEFRGYKPVSRSNAGGAGAPEHIFDANTGLIRVDDQFYCFALKAYADSRREQELGHLNRRLAHFAQPASKTTTDAQGGKATVSHEPLETHAAGEGAPKPTPGMGRKEK